MQLSDPSVISTTKQIVVSFGGEKSLCSKREDGIELALKIPQLAGPTQETICELADPEESTHGPFQICQTSNRIAGVALLPLDRSLEVISNELYRNLFEILGEKSCYRIWNYVPYINDVVDRLERYRSFNIGRWEAYCREFGEDSLCQHMPAASAVGIEDNSVALVFVAGSDPVEFIENPEQVPAYDYPTDYGPRAPSFARGATVLNGSARYGYLSGTSSIKGHSTIGEGCLQTQFDTTLHNLELVAAKMKLDLRNPDEVTSFKVYLRHGKDLDAARGMLESALGPATERTIYLNSAICRSSLNIEIEANARLPR